MALRVRSFGSCEKLKYGRKETAEATKAIIDVSTKKAKLSFRRPLREPRAASDFDALTA
jgi:hypothetical protein